MSIKVMTRVWESAPCKGSDLLVLLAMADIGGDDGGDIYPSVSTLAKKVRLSERAVQLILRRLEERGLIEVQAEAKQHSPRIYRVTFGVPEVQTLHPCETPGVKDSTPRGEKSGRSGVNQDSPKPLENRPENHSPSVVSPAVEKSDITAAVEAWNELADRCGLARVQRLTDARRKQLRARLKDCGGLEGWHAALAKIEASPGLRGENERGWRVDFDFVVRESKFTKLMEGTYGDGPWNGGGYSHGRKTASMLEGINKAFECPGPDPAEAQGGDQQRPDRA